MIMVDVSRAWLVLVLSLLLTLLLVDVESLPSSKKQSLLKPITLRVIDKAVNATSDTIELDPVEKG